MAHLRPSISTNNTNAKRWNTYSYLHHRTVYTHLPPAVQNDPCMYYVKAGKRYIWMDSSLTSTVLHGSSSEIKQGDKGLNILPIFPLGID